MNTTNFYLLLLIISLFILFIWISINNNIIMPYYRKRDLYRYVRLSKKLNKLKALNNILIFGYDELIKKDAKIIDIDIESKDYTYTLTMKLDDNNKLYGITVINNYTNHTIYDFNVECSIKSLTEIINNVLINPSIVDELYLFIKTLKKYGR